jgi:PPOX class probable F420-dependent enzyme
MIDLSTEFGARVARRLDKELIIWLTTVRADGTPQPSPVWFLWIDQTLLIYSRPNTPKLRNIEQNPKVALNFNSDEGGGDVIVFTGTAAIDSQAPPSNEIAAYQEKYGEHIVGINMTPELFARAYSVALRVTPTSVRGH